MKCNYCDFVWEDEEEYGKHLNATHTKCFYCSTVLTMMSLMTIMLSAASAEKRRAKNECS